MGEKFWRSVDGSNFKSYGPVGRSAYSSHAININTAGDYLHGHKVPQPTAPVKQVTAAVLAHSIILWEVILIPFLASSAQCAV